MAIYSAVQSLLKFCPCVIFQPIADLQGVVTVTSLNCISVLAIQGILLYVVFKATSGVVCCFAPKDVVACMFCSTHKSLTLGL